MRRSERFNNFLSWEIAYFHKEFTLVIITLKFDLEL